MVRRTNECLFMRFSISSSPRWRYVSAMARCIGTLTPMDPGFGLRHGHPPLDGRQQNESKNAIYFRLWSKSVRSNKTATISSCNILIPLGNKQIGAVFMSPAGGFSDSLHRPRGSLLLCTTKPILDEIRLSLAMKYAARKTTRFAYRTLCQ